ncbi:hypothetical protein ES703_90772 [subsurface metagenome]
MRFSCLWPLWIHEVSETEKNNLIFGRLYDRRKDLVTGHVRSRVLWKLYTYTETPSMKTRELMPFFTYEKQGRIKTHFAIFWRFFEYEKADSKKNLRFFYLPKFTISNSTKDRPEELTVQEESREG